MAALCVSEGYSWVLGPGGTSAGVNRASLLARCEISGPSDLQSSWQVPGAEKITKHLFLHLVLEDIIRSF